MVDKQSGNKFNFPDMFGVLQYTDSLKQYLQNKLASWIAFKPYKFAKFAMSYGWDQPKPDATIEELAELRVKAYRDKSVRDKMLNRLYSQPFDAPLAVDPAWNVLSQANYMKTMCSQELVYSRSLNLDQEEEELVAEAENTLQEVAMAATYPAYASVITIKLMELVTKNLVKHLEFKRSFERTRVGAELEARMTSIETNLSLLTKLLEERRGKPVHTELTVLKGAEISYKPCSSLEVVSEVHLVKDSVMKEEEKLDPAEKDPPKAIPKELRDNVKTWVEKTKTRVAKVLFQKNEVDLKKIPMEVPPPRHLTSHNFEEDYVNFRTQVLTYIEALSNGVALSLYRRKPDFCQKCRTPGHLLADCADSPKCAICAEAHLTSMCVVKCPKCKGKHTQQNCKTKTCTFCKKNGHEEKVCWKKKSASKKVSSMKQRAKEIGRNNAARGGIAKPSRGLSRGNRGKN